MYVLFTGRRAYSGAGGGGAVADSDLQIRWGAVIQSLRKRGRGSFFRPQFGLKIRRGGGEVPGPLPWIRHRDDLITGSSRWLTDRQL